MAKTVPTHANSTETKDQISWRERFAALGNLPSFFRLVWQVSPSLFLGNAFLRLIRAAIPTATLYIGKLIIDQVVTLSKHNEGDTRMLWWLVGAEFGLAILSTALGRAVALMDSLLGDLFANQTSIRLMEHAATLDLEQFEDATFYDKLERARRQTNGRTVLLSGVFGQVQELISVGFLAAGLAVYNPWLLVLILLAVTPSFIGDNYFNQRSYSLSRSWTPERRELDYLRYIGASDETAKEVKIFGISGFLIDRFRELSWQYYLKNKALAISRAGWGTLLTALGTAGYYGAYVWIVMRAVGGQITLGDLTFLAGSFRQVRGSLEGILLQFSSLTQEAIYLQDLFDYFAIKPSIHSPSTSRPFPNPIRQGFVFENVGFKYTNSERWALRNLSFTLQAGEKLALVGENGAGKTTLVKLLARLYDPAEGRILLDGYDLREYDLAELRRNIGVIFQDYTRFKMSAGVNIAVGDIDQRTNQDRIETSAQRSLADTVIAKLAGGYDQQLGRSFGKGVELSGGEWQKVALARAYMRDAQLIILDEPTAALDARAEYEVFQRFAKLTEGKSSVIISHRFSTVRMADRILVLENGTLLEIGSHYELLEKEGRYAELFGLQARGYQ
ncbi:MULTISPECIES: ABC transporter ATP-binding protein [unclassified Spirosoma]|uniref:ABC transporter ATP-binding protein n=1 Tax=unclassified Spirosoma TaxID=2621999 RepID=UPI00096353CD|nr:MULTISPECIES: ABC transporter ATP-binding protein [unclassified Spirosoma]MBN8821888.1 ABC transporter ATP-binding protein [Spirosoma sp.]OJW80628.1 MAG: ABC transporter ATP-binding protein [Spirosoma sp. 48-14]